jgi:sigma-E factor negative regulatory protein RseA
MKPEPVVDTGDPRWLMSAMADGEADMAECARCCAAWVDATSEARGSWHAYHLIGDVLRSEDLASVPGHDRAFLDRLRMRLADEPVILAPQALSTVAGSGARAFKRLPWAMPAAVAAGVMAVATVLVVARGPGGGAAGSSGPALAVAPAAVVAVAADSAPAATPAAGVSAQGSRIVRDAQLDRYLQAHRDYGTALPGSLPGGPGRSITTVSLDR